VIAAKEHQVFEIGFTAIAPVFDVM
jgi:hypothetical protein